MNVLLTGGTGFIGSRFVERLVKEGHHVYVLTRHPKQHKDTEFVSYISFNFPMKRLPFIHAIVNLAGESIFGYWSENKKEKILQSRLTITEKLIRILTQMEKKPDVFISGSAIGYYGMSENIIFTEKTTEHGNDFLAKVCHTWEQTAQAAEDFGIRTVYTRFGVVLDKNDGALKMMAKPVDFFVGGKIGTGRQWISWVHIEDCIELLLFCLENKNIHGPVNITAPHPKMNVQFINELAKVKVRPAFIPTPRAVLKLALGSMHQLVTKGQYVLPNKALKNGFEFKYPYLTDALHHIYK